MGVGHLLLSTHATACTSVMICAIRRLAMTVSDVCLKLGCFQLTSTYSALEVSQFCAIQIHDLLTYVTTIAHSHRWLQSRARNLTSVYSVAYASDLSGAVACIAVLWTIDLVHFVTRDRQHKISTSRCCYCF